VTFESVLFRGGEQVPSGLSAPDHFVDFNLDQVVDALTARREPYELTPLFFMPLHDANEVRYRQAACRDLEDTVVRRAIDHFAAEMSTVRQRRAHALQLRHRYHRYRWYREAIRVYVEAIKELHEDLERGDLHSEAMTSLLEYLDAYTRSAAFTTLAEEGDAIDEELAAIRYTVQIVGSRVTVRRYEGGDDYRKDVEQTFSRFKTEDAKDRLIAYPEYADLNHVEAQVLELVAALFPQSFGRLYEYCVNNEAFVDPRVQRFDREVQIFLSWLDFIAPMRAAGLEFCYPDVSTGSKRANVVDSFDVVLAAKLVREGGTVVTNGFALEGKERILVVTGPNQGGKTTFARMFGQLHYLAALGFPIPGTTATLPIPDRIFSHFGKEEEIETLRGRLEDELVRVHGMFELATSDSVFVINEGFSSTTLADAVFLGGEVVRLMIESDLLGVYVTFVDELTRIGEATVSMVATVDPDDPAKRTLRIVRRPADGLAYTAAIVNKYGVSYMQLKQRIAP
jgi:DNA mismatch repair protein MutS